MLLKGGGPAGLYHGYGEPDYNTLVLGTMQAYGKERRRLAIKLRQSTDLDESEFNDPQRLQQPVASRGAGHVWSRHE